MVRPRASGERAGRPRSDAELLADEPRDLAAVGAALGLAHDVADDRRRSPSCRRRAGARRRRGWRRARPGHDAARARRRRRSRARPSASTIAAGSPPSATSRSSTCLAAPAVTVLLARRARRARPAPPACTCDSRGSLDVDARDELGDPVGQRLRARRGRLRRRRPRRSRRSSARNASSCAASVVSAEVALVALGARRGQLGQRARGRARASPRVERDRDEVGLGEVAVVVRLLLGAQRRDRLGARVEVQRLLLDRRRPRAGSPPGARSRRGCPARGSGTSSCS